MKQFILFISVLSICISCKKVYNPDINPPPDVLVVDGLITNENSSYLIKLMRSSAFDGPSSEYNFVNGAKVSIFDNLGNNYKVTESRLGIGMYFTDSTELVGIPGRSYTLHIVTEDGNVYESSPQEMLSSASQDTVYPDFCNKTALVPTTEGEYRKVTTAGMDLVTDINSNGDILPRFRFKSRLTIVSQTASGGGYVDYRNLDDLVNLTEEKYTTTSLNIRSHIICFVPTEYIVPQTENGKIVSGYVSHRVITISRYRLNNEIYQYYKNMNLLLSAQGRIFDPIATQFKGNITCINNPQKLALGIFEASPVKTSVYTNMPGQKNIYQMENYPLRELIYNLTF
jgi:hypothetical protein